ncbi:uncharacterized protein LOC123914766 [Trifolium pratense]|uniref:Uncharacterized protein n=1 Tax=Trifolium pratense TaxID=57577 RepID=A0ACB0MD76_TRIPR|nr:uncharacterized protein LOC123914766 [Trifolium pratense]CAJ2679300.1 unnamed protein product [Trifolium pratense]
MASTPKPTSPEIPPSKVPLIRQNVDLLAQKLVSIEHFQGNKKFPMLHVDRKLNHELCVPWKDALIVKLLGRELEFNIMKNQLKNLWNLPDFDLMEFGNCGFYVVKFDMEEDRTKVINGVPWKLFDHYLSVCQFMSTIDKIRVCRSMSADAPKETVKTMVWVRIPNLHPVYYDENFLWALASAIGNPVKVERGRFARVCVDIELNEDSVSSVGINGKWYPVEYEDSVIICTQCGFYGHRCSSCAYIHR